MASDCIQVTISLQVVAYLLCFLCSFECSRIFLKHEKMTLPLFHLAAERRAFISSLRCWRTMCLLAEIPNAVAMESVLKEGSSTMTAP